jgi:hypothetical protein
VFSVADWSSYSSQSWQHEVKFGPKKTAFSSSE